MGAEKRPTDHLEPAPKKRGSERQITKDDVSEEEEQHEPGTFSRASEDVIKQRKIVRARRGLQASAPPSDNPANPFANIQLLPTKEGPETETEEHKGNDADTEAKTAQVTKKGPDEREEKLNNEKEENQSDKQQEIGDKDQDSKGLVANTSQAGVGNPTGGFGGFGGFGALASNSGEGLVFGLNSGSSTGFGGFGGLASSTTAPAFGTVSAASTASLLVNSTASASVFGSDIDKNPVQAAKVQLPEQVARETGEESESTLFSGNGVLFEWSDASKQWRERGRGEVRVNIHTSSGQGRIVMRQKGNLRVLLNANLWPDMALTLMDGKAGVTFACVNHVFMTDVAEESVPGHIDGKLMTYALRISPIETLDTFINVVNENKRRSAA